MGLLRADVWESSNWWELRLLDLEIVADGATEQAMLDDLKHTLIAEYHLARHFQRTPFVRLFTRPCPPEVRKAWDARDDRCLRHLNLPSEVSEALAAVFLWERHDEVRVESKVA